MLIRSAGGSVSTTTTAAAVAVSNTFTRNGIHFYSAWGVSVEQTKVYVCVVPCTEHTRCTLISDL